MSKLPRITAAKLITILTQNGFELIRQKGSHCGGLAAECARSMTVEETANPVSPVAEACVCMAPAAAPPWLSDGS